MGATAAIHPTDDTLRSHAIGELDSASAESVNQHLEGCSACQRRASEISPDGALGPPNVARGKPSSTGPCVSSLDGLSILDDGENVEPPPQGTLPPGLVDHPDYEVIRELGQGGMGTVYLAKNRLMGRLEVLKVVSKDRINRPGALDRFLIEIRNAASLHHTNVVTAYSAMRIGESIIFAMEFVDGLDLSKLVKAKGPLPVANACNYVHQTALGLQHASELGMVHRDIKPGNLMLTRHGNRAVIKVLDFGLAKVKSEGAADGGLTYEGQMLGTPEFVSPEQISDARRADIRADIYSLGCTLYYLLTAAPPFHASSLYEILQAHHSMDAFPLNLARPEVPVELAALVARMMAKEPARRFQTPKDVAQALLPFFKKGMVEIARPTPEMSLPGVVEEDRASTRSISVPAQHAPQTPPPPAALPTKTPSAAPCSEPAWESLITIKEAEPLTTPGQAASRSARLPRRIWPSIALGVIVLGLTVAYAVIIRVKTASGMIVVDNVPVDAVVEVDGTKITVTPTEGAPVTIEAKSGEHSVSVKRDGVELLGESVTIKSGKQAKLTVRYERPAASRPGNNGPSADTASRSNTSESDIGKGEDSRNSVPTDADRRAAETVLMHGGSVTIRVNGQEQTREAGRALPTEAFQLTHVRFGDQPKLTDAGLEPFHGLTNLLEFRLSKAPKVTDAGLGHMRNLARLKELWLDDSGVTDAGLVHLEAFPTLNALALGGAKGITDAGLAHLEGLRNLKLLALGGSRVTDAGLVHLRGLAQLEGLWLHATRVADAGLVHLRGLTKLRGLLLWQTQVTDAGLVHLQGLPQLDGLMLGATRVTDAGVERLGSLSKLKHLWLDGTRVTDAGLRHLRGLAQLESLALHGTRVTDAGLAHLRGLTNLRELRVGDTKVTDAGLVHLQTLPQLELLALGGTKVTDAGAVRLGDLAQLKQLWLDRTRVTDDALAQLKRLKHLTDLNLEGTKVTAAGLEELKKSISACRVIVNSGVPGREQNDEARADSGEHRAGDRVSFLAEMEYSDLRVPKPGYYAVDGTLGRFKEKIVIKGKESPHGIFMHPPARGCSEVTYSIDGKWDVFQGSVAIYRASNQKKYDAAPLTFEVTGDNVVLWPSRPVPTFDEPQPFSVDVQNVKKLRLQVTCPGRNNYAWAVWLEPRLGRQENKPLAPTAGPPRKRAAKTLSPNTRLFHIDEFNDPKSGLLKDLSVPHDPSNGRSDGVYFAYSPGGWHAWPVTDVRSEGACEVVGRVRSKHPKKTAAWLVIVHNKAASRGFLVKVNVKGELFLEPSPWKDAEAFRNIDPRLGPIVHRAINPGNEFNKLLLVLKKREVVIFVNDVQVCAPVRFGYDITPSTLEFGASGPGKKRAEFDRLEIREFIPPNDATAKAEAAAPAKLAPVEAAGPENPKPMVADNPRKLTTNSVGMTFTLIRAGEFMMGSPEDDTDAAVREKPRHKVSISPFYLGVTEVTQAQYKAVMSNNPSHFSSTGDGKDKVAGRPTEQHPVERVSWFDAVRFCDTLSEKEGRTPFYREKDQNQDRTNKGPGYRLPTEAEWEYACRAETSTKYCFGDAPARLSEYAWFHKNAGGMTHPVGEKRPNGFGLYDMHGNVTELCSDWLDDAYYQNAPARDPQGPFAGKLRVTRGGQWRERPPHLRSASRGRATPGLQADGRGFRVAVGMPDH